MTAARFAAGLGVRVALVETDRIGGDCTWTGFVPSKPLLKSAKLAHEMRDSGRYGMDAAEPRVDFPAVMGRVRSVMAEVYRGESAEVLRGEGIDVYLGEARFTSPRSVEVDGQEIRGRRFLIATGAGPVVPPISGLESVGFLTYETFWSLEELPGRLLVIGGGAVGCELAQAAGQLGARVTVLEQAASLLPGAEPEASELLRESLTGEGVEVRVGCGVERVWGDGEEVRVWGGGEEFAGDALLVAVGRRAKVDGLDLESAGVAHGSRGVTVGDKLRTSQRHIYAAGDCTGGPQFSHYAGFQGFLAARNALLPGAGLGVRKGAPWAIFTDPEIAGTGLTEAQAVERFGEQVRVGVWPMERVDRAAAEGDTRGFIKVVYRKNGGILGVTIAGTRAGEMIHEWALAMDRSLKLGDLAQTMHVYPTFSMGNQQVALELRLEGMLAGWPGRVIKKLARMSWR